ncbi:hypothetical protein SAMN04488136_11184 [Vibrio xiamenensis]|uniref:Hemolysin-type calcium-binding repeat-containing protein n=1 Tax=Vibrio xiamenensis TaxID=861298 RepID=A0A1G8AR44_9VIBR|nr:hypothetical protein [Vibrio xiamenensis]SDH23455.1 hypothetical protein SAMN04488136_11184 [Vibrio xiamenensis]
MSVIIGTSNLDSTGSSAGLTEENGTLVSDYYDENGVLVYTFDSSSSVAFNSVQIQSDTWDNENYKETKVDGNYEVITVDNFVDVDITNASDLGYSHIDVLNAKRGTIDTSGADSDDSIYIAVSSNSYTWSNLFTITTGEGDDDVTLANVTGSQYTSFDISLGDGNDVLDISDLLDAKYDKIERTVDGGDGFDVLITNGDDNVEFSGFEVVEGTGFDDTLELDSETLAANDDGELGLVIANISISYSDDLTYTTSDLDQEQTDYLDNLGYDADSFEVVTVTSSDGEYTLLVESDSYA